MKVSFKKELTVFYNDFKSEDGKLKTVHLTFDYDKRENEYFLTDKSGE